MLRRRTRVWRQLRSARTSALSEEQRRLELREAQLRSAGRADPPPAGPPASPDSSGAIGAAPTEAASEPAGDTRAG